MIVRLEDLYREMTGQGLVITGLAMAVIFAMAGLAIDVGQLRYAQRKLQSAADAAALAAGLELGYCGGSTACSAMTGAAKQALAENGYAVANLLTQCSTTTASGLTLTVNNGPCAMGSASADPNYGNANYVETVVSQSRLTYFLRIFGFTSVPLTARAEATAGNDPFCLYTSTQNTGSSAPSGLQMSGNSKLSASCGIVDESGASNALQVGSNTSLTASAIEVHGGVSGSPSPAPVTNVPVLPDPLAWLNSDIPPAGSCSTYSGGTTISPGTYCGGITVSSNSPVTFQPGVYILQGNLNVSGSGGILGNGVTFYFSSGSLEVSGTPNVDLVAPTTGTYAGVLIFQNQSDTTAMVLSGDSTSVYQGAIYAPGGSVTLSGNGNDAAYTIVDSAQVIMSGTNSWALGDNYSSLPGGSPARAVTSVLTE